LLRAFPWLKQLRELGRESVSPGAIALDRDVQSGDDGLPEGQYRFTISEVARLAGKSPRQIHHDIVKGALEARSWTGAKGARLFILRRVVHEYLKTG
jgi:hypothetical protein